MSRDEENQIAKSQINQAKWGPSIHKDGCPPGQKKIHEKCVPQLQKFTVLKSWIQNEKYYIKAKSQEDAKKKLFMEDHDPDDEWIADVNYLVDVGW